MCIRDSQGRDEEVEDDALFFRMLDFLNTGRHLCFGAPIGDPDLFCSETERSASTVHRRIPAAEHNDTLAGQVEHRRLCVFPERTHEVHAGEELVRRVDADEILPFNPQESGETGADANEPVSYT